MEQVHEQQRNENQYPENQSPWMYKIICHNGGYLLLFRRRQRQSFEIS